MTARMAATRKENAAERKAKRKAKAKRIKSRPRPSLSRLKAKLWELLSPAVKAAHQPFCFTCDNGPLAGHNHQCGHMFAKGRAHALSAFHPGNLRPQCINCNHGLEGNGAEYGRRYMAQYGEAAFEEIRALARTPHKWTPMEIEMLIAKIRVSLEHYEGYYREVYKPLAAAA